MFDFLKKKSATALPTWTFTKQGIIWRVMFLGGGDELKPGVKQKYIIGEHRTSAGESAERKASFFLLDELSGAVIWDDFALMDGGGKPVGEGWWIGLETTFDGFFYLHGYLDPTVPEHRGIYAVDAASKTIRWQMPGATYLCITEGKMLAYRDELAGGFAERRYVLLDLKSGEVIESIGSQTDEVNRLRDGAVSDAAQAGVALPSHVEAGMPQFEQVKSIAAKYVNAAGVIGGFDFIASETYTVLGFHEQTDLEIQTLSGNRVKALDYKLKLIETKTGKVLFAETLASQMSGLLVDGFFTKGNTLYYVRDRASLVALRLA
ncbi:MAG: DUF4905 domain-containing protein [Rhizobacter sp.]|nr:DUF4905 domain-containing protein [Chlorobiales bacterium]